MAVGQEWQDFFTLTLSHYFCLTLLSLLVCFTNEIDSAAETEDDSCVSKLKRLEMTQIECW